MYDFTVFPPELWQKIFALACTDGGRTGYSIAQTCRLFHAQSSNVRFHSLALSSIESVEGFLEFIRKRPEGQKPFVRHLSLTLLSTRKLRQAHLYPSHPSTAAREDKRKALQARFVDAANELFVLVAPTLQTLCLTTGYFLPLAPFPCDMPVLEELTIMGSISTITGEKLRRLPALKRFHLIPWSAHANADVATALTASALCTAPLTHLRLSHIHGIRDLPSVLGRTLGVLGRRVSVDDGTSEQRDTARATLPHIQEVVVHTIIPYLGRCGNAYMGYRRETEAFDAFARACNDVECLHVVVLSRQQWDFRWKERLYHDWLARIEGGRGCWVRDAEEEAALERRVAREGDADRSLEDLFQAWNGDEDEDQYDFSGDNGGYDDFEEAIAAERMDGICGGVFDEEVLMDSKASSCVSAVGRMCTIV